MRHLDATGESVCKHCNAAIERDYEGRWHTVIGNRTLCDDPDVPYFTEHEPLDNWWTS